MNRRTFLQTLSLVPMASCAMNLNEFGNQISQNKPTDKMPLLFIGHGNPMYAISENKYKKVWTEMGKKLPIPKAVLCISAHWLTNGTSVTMADKPKTIHDFGGFPQTLFDVQYPAPGAPDYAKLAISEIKSTKVHEDVEWGLDHGAWSVLRNMYPEANIPIFQMSIDYAKPPIYHFNLAKELAALRSKGVLIISSGNVVHNLGMIQWDETSKPFDWALQFDELVKKNIEDNNPAPLINYQKLGNLATLAHPTNDHYLPLMYTLGLRQQSDSFQFFNDTMDMGSLSMRSVLFL
jgi:4,5-DOPA dioxygenase extradiol